MQAPMDREMGDPGMSKVRGELCPRVAHHDRRRVWLAYWSLRLKIWGDAQLRT